MVQSAKRTVHQASLLEGLMEGDRALSDLRALLRAHSSSEEDAETLALVHRLRPAWNRKYLTKGELERICRWKSARAVSLIRTNNHHRIRKATYAAFETRNETERLAALVSLRGVSIPMASAILMLLSPKRYGVIDIRVWQLLHDLGVVEENPRGTKFTPAQWATFLGIIRSVAVELGVTARDVERTLFKIHQERQEGLLYAARRTV